VEQVENSFEFDPFDPAFFEDPYLAYRHLRQRHPVYRKENGQPRIWPHYWMLSRAADVDAAAADWRTFTSVKGTLVDTDVSLLPPNMFHMDPPRHDVHRRILSRALTPSVVAELEPFVRSHAKAVIDTFKTTGQADAATDFAQLIPSTVVCQLMGLPPEDRQQFLRWNLDTIGGSDFTSAAALSAYGQMEEYWKQLVRWRRDGRTDDLVSQILAAVAEERADLPDNEVWGFCSLLHDASQNTTINMITNAVIVLARHPDQRRQLAERPEQWPAAVEELLRFVSPVQGLARATTEDVEVAGVHIPAGDQVLLLYGSANHDEAVYHDPETLDLARQPRAQWTFGHGIHYCLGAAVAKLETRVALQCLTEALGDWELDEAGLVRNQLVPTRGVAHAPISFAALEA
jgi:cytochrome P450